MTRPEWDDYFLNIAIAVAMRADCTRRQVGAVVVEPESKHIIATGYNGTAPGKPGCLSGACPRGQHWEVSRYTDYPYEIAPPYYYGSVKAGCGCGSLEWPCEEAVEPGSSYDTGAGSCIALHAEQNATVRAGVQCRGAWIYITDVPCDGCMRFMKGAGYSKITWPTGEWTSE